jgi:predicted outer membrane protein
VAPQVRQFAQQMDKELAAAFDPQYMQSRLPDHPPRWRSSNERLGAGSQLKAFTQKQQKQLPILEHHLQMAEGSKRAVDG